MHFFDGGRSHCQEIGVDTRREARAQLHDGHPTDQATEALCSQCAKGNVADIQISETGDGRGRLQQDQASSTKVPDGDMRVSPENRHEART